MSIKMSPMLSDGAGLMDDAVLEIKKPKIRKHEEEVLPAKKSEAKTIHQRIKEAPIVDKAKVEAFKHKISYQAYTVDAQRLAEKMLAFETDLFSKPIKE